MPRPKKTAAEKRATNAARQARHRERLKLQATATAEEGPTNQKDDVIVSSDAVDVAEPTETGIQELAAQLAHTALGVDSEGADFAPPSPANEPVEAGNAHPPLANELPDNADEENDEEEDQDDNEDKDEDEDEDDTFVTCVIEPEPYEDEDEIAAPNNNGPLRAEGPEDQLEDDIFWLHESGSVQALDDDSSAQCKDTSFVPSHSPSSSIVGTTQTRKSSVEDDNGDEEIVEEERLSERAAVDDHWKHEAEEVLKKAWKETCLCDEHQPDLQPPHLSLAQMTRYWQERFPDKVSKKNSLPLPLASDYLLPRNGACDDYKNIPWQSLLAGDPDAPPSLDLQKSEATSENLHSVESLEIRRRWDVDSFIALITNLGVHRDGFNIQYRPSFLQRMKQNPYVLFNGRTISQLKNLEFGHGVVSAGYTCHVFFPHMPIAHKDLSSQLNDQQQRIWVDDFILPALRSCCSNDVLQHHPRSYVEADAKAWVKKELHPHGAEKAINVRYCVPEGLLDKFWNELLHLCAISSHPEYREPFLVISGHDLKLSTKRDSAAQARTEFLAHLNRCFNVNNQYMPPANCWLDLGLEDTPEAEPEKGITLMLKTTCGRHWAELFNCPRSTPSLTQKLVYPYAWMRDAVSTHVILRPSNVLHYKGGIALSKAYELHKDIFATPLKGVKPFDMSQLEGLCYSQELLDRWYQINSGGQGGPEFPHLRKQLQNAYSRIKARLVVALSHTTKVSFGVRQEYRINMSLFRTLNLNPDVTSQCLIHTTEWTELDTPEDASDSSEVSNKLSAVNLFTPQPSRTPPQVTDEDHDALEEQSEGHRPYYILATKDLNAYMAADLNRWLLCLEALMSQLNPAPEGLKPASQERQLINGVMASALIRTLRQTFGGLPSMHRDLWLGSWKLKRRRRPRQDVSDGHQALPQHQLGLDYRTSLTKHGLPWLPRDIIHWNNLPTFTPSAIRKLALAKNGFEKSFKKTVGISKILGQEDQFFQLFRYYLQRSKEFLPHSEVRHGRRWVLDSAAELVVKEYIVNIITLLSKRSVHKGPEQLTTFTSSLTLDQAAGCGGLTYVMIEKLIGCTPRIALVNSQIRKGVSHFKGFNSGLWSDKLEALFAWDDGADSTSGPHTWKNSSFRRLTRRLHDIAVTELDKEAGLLFKIALKGVACEKLWIIPQYDANRLSAMWTVTKNHSKKKVTEITAMSDLERTNWLMPQLESRYFALMCATDKAIKRNRKLNAKEQRVRKQVADALQDHAKLHVLSDKYRDTKESGLPKDPESYGQVVELQRAKAFLKELEEVVSDSATETFDEDSVAGTSSED